MKYLQQLRKVFPILGVVVLGSILGLILWVNWENIILFRTPKIPRPSISSVEDQKLAKNFKVTLASDTKVELLNNPLIFKKEEGSKFTQEKAQNLASKMGFTSPPERNENGQLLTWIKGTENLAISLSNEKLSYRNSEPALQGSTPTLEKAKSDFGNLYNTLGLNQGLVDLNRPTVEYSLLLTSYNDEAKPTVAPNSANFIRLTYPFSVNNKTILGVYPEVTKATVVYSRNGKLINADLPLIFEAWSEFINYPTLSQKKLLTLLGEGKATLVKFKKVKRVTEVKADPLVELEVTKITNGYLKPTGNYQYLIPIYIVEGEGLTAPGETIEAVFYLPAFSDKLLQ